MLECLGMSQSLDKPSKSDRITKQVIEVDAMRMANPYMGVVAACAIVGLSRDTYYARKREEASTNEKGPACKRSLTSSTTEAVSNGLTSSIVSQPLT